MVPYNWCKSYSFTLEGMGFELKKKTHTISLPSLLKESKAFCFKLQSLFPKFVEWSLCAWRMDQMTSPTQ